MERLEWRRRSWHLPVEKQAALASFMVGCGKLELCRQHTQHQSRGEVEPGFEGESDIMH